MTENTLSVFVDESGRFLYPDVSSRFYIIGLVFHDQAAVIGPAIDDLERHFRDLHLEKLCFHAGPIIRQEKAFSVMDRSFRYRIFAAMMAFVRRIDIRCHCLVVDKKNVTSAEHIVRILSSRLEAFLFSRRARLSVFDRVKIYYDCGQSPVTNLLHENFHDVPGVRFEFAQGVRPENYRLFQVADLVCSIRYVEEKLRSGERMSASEFRFFGGPKEFRHNVLRYLKRMEI